MSAALHHPVGNRSRERPLTRADFESDSIEVIVEGRWANAVLYRVERAGVVWVVKDFRPRAFLARNLIGRLLIRREYRVLAKLSGHPGVPQGVARLDAHALAYQFVEGQDLRKLRGNALGPDFYPALEHVVRQLHSVAHFVHCDLRNARNILVTLDGGPALIDFQSAVDTRWLPGPLRRLLERIDLAAVYKHWSRHQPETLDPQRREALHRVQRWRRLWFLRGYFGVARWRRRRIGLTVARREGPLC